jgi:uncharacterized OB-fold protein
MTAESSPAVLLPSPDALTAPFWEAAQRHELVVQRCENCGQLRFPPVPNCPYCSSERYTWRQVAGRGTVYSYIWVHQALRPQFTTRIPYNVAQISLEEDERVIMTADIVELGDTTLAIGLPVEVVFDDVTPEDTIPRWRPTP